MMLYVMLLSGCMDTRSRLYVWGQSYVTCECLCAFNIMYVVNEFYMVELATLFSLLMYVLRVCACVSEVWVWVVGWVCSKSVVVGGWWWCEWSEVGVSGVWVV